MRKRLITRVNEASYAKRKKNVILGARGKERDIDNGSRQSTSSNLTITSRVGRRLKNVRDRRKRVTTYNTFRRALLTTVSSLIDEATKRPVNVTIRAFYKISSEIQGTGVYARARARL